VQRSRRAVVLVAVVLVAGAVGCGGAGNGANRSTTIAQARPCIDPGRPLSIGQVQSMLRADIDGDGEKDRVSTIYDAVNPRSCRYLLVVQISAGREAVAPISTDTPPAGPPLPGEPPTVDSVVEIGANPSVQILVRVRQGASTSQAVIYSYRRGKLTQLAIMSRDRTFAYNAGASFIGGVDCLGGARSGRVVALTGGQVGPSTTLWQLGRDVYELRGPRFVRVSSRVSRYRGTEDELRRRFPASGGQAFPSCTAAVRLR
jgi:hypothetical protein